MSLEEVSERYRHGMCSCGSLSLRVADHKAGCPVWKYVTAIPVQEPDKTIKWVRDAVGVKRTPEGINLYFAGYGGPGDTAPLTIREIKLSWEDASRLATQLKDMSTFAPPEKP